MIRKYEKKDFDEIKKIIYSSNAHLCAWLTTDEAIRSDIENAKIALVYEENGVKAYGYMDKTNPENNYKKAHFYIVVHPDYWWQNIPHLLFERIKPYIIEESPDKATIGFPSDHIEHRIIFKQYGFKHSFFSLRLEYEGPRFDDLDLKIRPYNNEDFQTYLKIYSEGFYNLRKTNDMKPHLVYTEEDYNNKTLRNEILENSEGLYTFIKDNQMIGFGKLTDYIDIIVVDQNNLRKGYGKNIVKHCVNKLIDEGHETVALYVLDSNQAAINLYRTLNFKVKAVIEVLEYKNLGDN